MPELHYCSQAASTEEIVVDWTEEGRCHNGRLSEQRLRITNTHGPLVLQMLDKSPLQT